MSFLSFENRDEGLVTRTRPSRCYQAQVLRPRKVNLSVALLRRTVAVALRVLTWTVWVLVLTLFSRVILWLVWLIVWHFSLHFRGWVCALTNSFAPPMFRRNIFTGQET
jgi:hypothetical protein